ncbi:hypothetical protein OXX79_000404 [Metschnikowia pulcherrima]
MITVEDIAKWQEEAGRELTPADLATLRPVRPHTLKEEGDSGFTPQTLGEALPKAVEGEVVEETTQHDYVAFETFVQDVLAQEFKESYELSDVSSFKWCETLVSVFDMFEGSQKILTTKDYLRADLSANKVQWDRFAFKGTKNITHAASILDRKIVHHLTSNKLCGPLTLEGSLTTRKFWIKASTLAKLSRTEPYSQYIEDTCNFMMRLQDVPFEKNLAEYYNMMQKKYDKTFISFMDKQGVVTFVLFRWYHKTKFEPAMLKYLDEQLAKHRIKPEDINGGQTLLKEIDSSPAWQEGIRDFQTSAMNDLKRRRLHQNEPTILAADKKIKLSALFNSKPLSSDTPLSDGKK